MRRGDNVLRFKVSTGGHARRSTSAGVRRLIALAPVLGSVNPSGIETVEGVMRRLIDAPALAESAIAKAQPIKVHQWVRTQALRVAELEDVFSGPFRPVEWWAAAAMRARQ